MDIERGIRPSVVLIILCSRIGLPIGRGSMIVILVTKTSKTRLRVWVHVSWGRGGVERLSSFPR